ncbi:MAG: hypothetical protein HPY83_00055 [Anaerolineae bacterium]|nr:hypothetical protein [Anaerolineae bacterium]
MVVKGLPRPSRALGPSQATAPYLSRALLAVEGRLHSLYARHNPGDERRRLASIAAATDAQSPLWDEFLQITYLENVREGLRSTLLALDQQHGRHP